MHAITCKIGGGPTNKLHAGMADVLVWMFKEAGCETRREVVIPEFTKQAPTHANPHGVTEGVLDILAWAPMMGELLIDVAVRHPASGQYRAHASHHNGWANSVASAEKRRRYPPAGGRSVCPAPMETWGRIGDDLFDTLQLVAGIARERSRAAGFASPRFLSKWLLALGSVLARGVSRCILDAVTPERAAVRSGLFVAYSSAAPANARE
jgi:hypothetical protein